MSHKLVMASIAAVAPTALIACYATGNVGIFNRVAGVFLRIPKGGVEFTPNLVIYLLVAVTVTIMALTTLWVSRR